MPRKKTTTEFKRSANQVHSNYYDYSLWPDIIRTKDIVEIICPEHGKFSQLLNSHLRGSKCKRCAQQQKESAWITKYGVSNPSKLQRIKDKTVRTNIARYGATQASKLDSTKAKIKDTKKERYGHQNYNNLDAARITKMQLYGDKNYNNRSVECIKRIKETKLRRYGDERYNNNKKRQYTNMVRYNTRWYSQRDMTEVLPLLTSYSWMVEEHHIQRKPLILIAKQLHVSIMTVHNYMKSHNIQVKRYSSSIAEQEICSFLLTLNITALQSNRTVITPLELDIYIPKYKLAIEYCGLYWHSDQHSRIDNGYHKRKHDLCANKGVQLITIFEDEWTHRTDQVKSKLLSLLRKDNRERIFARKCKIVNICHDKKHTFFNKYHIQKDGPSSINIGLVYNNDIVAVMGFTRYPNTFYLTRFATSKLVIGGFSKLLKHFQRNHQWDKLTSFADLRWSNGNLYSKTGWTLDKIIPPDYCYSPDGHTRIHKFNYRRKHLPKLLNNFDPSLSERKNCDNNGILRIWDCGKLKFTITNEKIHHD